MELVLAVIGAIVPSVALLIYFIHRALFALERLNETISRIEAQVSELKTFVSDTMTTPPDVIRNEEWKRELEAVDSELERQREKKIRDAQYQDSVEYQNYIETIKGGHLI